MVKTHAHTYTDTPPPHTHTRKLKEKLKENLKNNNNKTQMERTTDTYKTHFLNTIKIKPPILGLGKDN